MGEVVYLEERYPEISKMANDENTTLSSTEIKRLEAIRDDVEELMNVVAALRCDPNAVALAAARFGVMRMTQLYGRAFVTDFTIQCIENMELAQDLTSEGLE